MLFNEFKGMLQKHISAMLKDVQHLFMVEVDKDILWNTYLDNFPNGTNEIFRERREHDCSSCRHFIKSFGNIVTIKNNIVTTIWDFTTGETTYQPVINALSLFIKSNIVSDVFITKELAFGIDKNYEEGENGKNLVWEHLYYKLPETFKNRSSDTVDSVKGQLRDVRNVFKRSLEEISEDSILSVLELISQNSLYKGEEWKAVLEKFLTLHKAYNKLDASLRDNFCWEQSLIVGPVIGKIRNHSIGALLTDITEGKDLDNAVSSYEAIVAPSNYKRPKAVFTKKMLKDAKAKLEEMGLLDSLKRRFATLDDITVNNILYANRDASKRIAGSVFDDMAESVTAINPKSFDRTEEISIGDFLKNILPSSKKVEVLFENRHNGNLVSLIAPGDSKSPSLFKWGNAFSWAYSGNMTDSMKERVKAAGGKIDGVLRFSIQWNDDPAKYNPNDFDAHCIEPSKNEIYFGNKTGHMSSGMLDVDIIHPSDKQVAVENITWSNRAKMPEGVYSFFVHCYNNRGGRTGFSAEIEFDGQIYSFCYNKELRNGEKIPVAKVLYSRKDGFKVIEELPSSTSSRSLWSLETNQFYPVSVCMFSPNYWDAQEGIGNRHYFFMLKGCVNDEAPNGFFNEFLKEELLSQKRVFEALGARMKVKSVDDQLSGLGFCTTKRNSLIVRVEGQFNRVLKVSF